MEEDDGAPSRRSSPPTPKKVKLESEQPKQLLKAEDHSEDESEEIEDEDGDGSPQSPPLLDMFDLPVPLSSPLPPTPPLPSSPRDFNMEQQDSEDEGPPPGWDNTYQLKEQVEQMLTPAAVSANSSDIKMEDVQQDAQNVDGAAPELVPLDIKVEEHDSEDEGPPPGWDSKCQPESDLQVASPTITQSDIKMEDVQQDGRNGEDAAPELVASDVKVEEEDSEDEGPPPGWDSKCLPESELQVACATITQSDISDKKTEDVQQDAWNGDSPQPRLRSPIPSDIKMEEQDSEDEGPPPGWDSKCQPKPELQTPCSTITQSDIKTDDVQQDARNGDGPHPQHPSPGPTPELVPSDMKVEEQDSEDEGPPPGWDSKCHPQPESTITQSDIKTEDIQQDARNGDDPQSQDHSPIPELVPSDIKVEEHDSEDEGPPPGWDSKFQPEPELQTPNLTTPPSNSKIEDDQQKDEGLPPGWDSKCQPEPELQTPNLTTPSSDSKIEDDQQDDEGPPPGWGSTPPQLQLQDHPSLPSPILPSGARMECEQKNVEAVVERPQPPPKQQSVTPMKPQIPVPKPPARTGNPEMGQMVCGSCRRLLSYPKGARYVECGCCLEENYVLEEHEVGQVICGGCDVLLMYPYGAPKVRCVNCSTETEIGDQNRRPPLSEQQRRGRRHLNRVQTGKC